MANKDGASASAYLRDREDSIKGTTIHNSWLRSAIAVLNYVSEVFLFLFPTINPNRVEIDYIFSDQGAFSCTAVMRIWLNGKLVTGKVGRTSDTCVGALDALLSKLEVCRQRELERRWAANEQRR